MQRKNIKSCHPGLTTKLAVVASWRDIESSFAPILGAKQEVVISNNETLN